MPGLNSQGQESAPFEVLVAVVIMGFVLFMAFQAINIVVEEQCKAKLRNEMVKFKQAIQDAVKGNSVSTSFLPELCFKKPSRLLIQPVTEGSICGSICGKQLSECLLFTFRAENHAEALCMEATPVFTNFLDISPCDVGRSGYELVNLKNPPTETVDGETRRLIPGGSYVIENVTQRSGSVPNLCVYRKTN